ncbi:MAG: glycosyltransferase family 2 protein, partial [Planctomycetaceae bacterium]|nr:glycosyltransferase family 2 protein [Planctomycetaceae bacterium]
MTSPRPSVVIPTYQRDQVLIDTLRSLLQERSAMAELVIVDQSEQHDNTTAAQLEAWAARGDIRWIRRDAPGIPQAMNAGLLAAKSDLVLFLDDDIVPSPGLVAAHRRAHANRTVAAVVGQVIQPWQQPEQIEPPHRLTGLQTDFDFPFHSTISGPVRNVMAGNLSVVRETAIAIGGFDEQFIGSAYRFETEFARRLNAAGETIWFSGDASIRHLRVPSGG